MKAPRMSSGCVAIAAVLLSMVASVAKAQDVTQDDDSVPLSVLITICVVVFFATVIGVICFIQFCIKNYNPLDYCFIFCTKDKEPPPPTDVQKNELGMLVGYENQRDIKKHERDMLAGYETQSETKKLVRESHNQASGRQVLVMRTEDLYARVNKPGQRTEIVETTEIDGGRDNAAHTVSTDVFTKETVSDERRATENLYSTTTTTTSNQRENVFVHDNNIILREPPAKYRSESFNEDVVDGEIRTERYTYSTGYTPSSSREKLVVNMSGDDSERMRYYLEQVEGRKEVYTNESGETVIMVRDEPEVCDIETNLNIQSEENGYMNEERQEVRHMVTRKVVTTEGYQQEPSQQFRQETHVIRSAPTVTKVENIRQDDEISSGNHVENIEVSRNYIVSEAVDDTDDAQLQAAIQEIEMVTSEAPEQVAERREVRVVQTTTTTTSNDEQQGYRRDIPQAPPPTSILKESREAHYIRSQAEGRPDIPTRDYIIVHDDEEDEHIQRRGKSMMAIWENKTRMQGRADRHSYHGQHQSRVEESHPAESHEHRTVVRREERVVQGGPEVVKTYVYETPEEQTKRTVVTREERFIQTEPQQMVSSRVHESPSTQEGRTVVRREERVVQGGPEVVKTYMYETPENQSQQSVVRREERVITSVPQQIVTARIDEIPESQEDRIRREQQTVIRREERIVQNAPHQIVTTNVYAAPSSQGESSMVREEHFVERTGPTTTKHVYVSEGEHGERRVITREEEIIEDSPSTFVTTADATDGAAQAEVTYRVIKRSSQIVEQPEEDSRDTSNKDWYVSSATLIAPKPMETVYVDLGQDEASKTTTTTTTTYTMDTGEQ